MTNYKLSLPTLSVVIPTKNSAKTIGKCLSSLMQYYERGYINEILVVDGKSHDGTLDILKKFPVTTLSDEGKGNIGSAYDIGWRTAKSELILLLDSDVFLGDNFFPAAFELFTAKVGWVSCGTKAVITNRLTKLQGEYWAWSSPIISSRPSSFQRIYGRIMYGGSQSVRCGGPCMLVRRTCLEQVNGFKNLHFETLRVCGDISVSQRIANRGWRIIWWPNPTVYHCPRGSFKGLTKQYIEYGQSIAFMQAEEEFRAGYTLGGKIIGILCRLASPIIGFALSLRFRNLLHVVVYSVPRYAVAVGYIVGWFRLKSSR